MTTPDSSATGRPVLLAADLPAAIPIVREPEMPFTMTTYDSATVHRMLYTNTLFEGPLGGSSMPGWLVAAFATVPRHQFLRRFYRRCGGGWLSSDEGSNLHLETCYGTAARIIQLDGDCTIWPKALQDQVSGTPTAECVDPDLLARMLDALRLDEDTTVLHTPTGSGYAPALLSYLLGGDQVTTLGVDATLADRAHTALHDTGYQPTIVVADSILPGWEQQRPYGRILATCAVPAIPPAWIEQTRPGGMIVAGLWRGSGTHPVVALTVHADGTATGRLLRPTGALLPCPGHRLVPPIVMEIHEANRAGRNPNQVEHISHPPSRLTDPDFVMFATLALTGVHALRDPTSRALWYVNDQGGAVNVDPRTGTLIDYGPRLSDQIVATHRTWWRIGSPKVDRLGLTITTTGEHRYWLDNPNRPLWTQVGSHG